MIQGLHNIGCVTGTVLLCIMHTEFILVHLFCFVGIRLNIPSPILQQRHFNFYNFPFIVTFWGLKVRKPKGYLILLDKTNIILLQKSSKSSNINSGVIKKLRANGNEKWSLILRTYLTGVQTDVIYYDCYGEQVERYNIFSTTTIKNSVYAINAIKHLYLRTKAALMNSF